MSGRGWWIALLLVGCKKNAVERAENVANADSFWPEAPAVTAKPTSRALRYNPDNITAYTMTADGGTPAGTGVRVEFKMTLALAFQRGATPRARDARMTKLELTVNGPGERMAMKLDHDAMTVEQAGKGSVTYKRGDASAVDVAAMTDKPFTTLVFGDDNTVKVHSIVEHPFTQIGGDMLDDALVLFPDLPAQAVAPGYQWSATRDTKMGGGGARANVNYHFEYLGDGACPSGAKSCAQLSLTASLKDVEVVNDGVTAKVTFGMAGKVFLDTERGALDESRVHMVIDLAAGSVKLPIGATYSVKPTN